MIRMLFKAGDYGGNVTISLLEVDIRADHHGSMFVCEAKNEALGQSVHNAMTISVNCEWWLIFKDMKRERSMRQSEIEGAEKGGCCVALGTHWD